MIRSRSTYRPERDGPASVLALVEDIERVGTYAPVAITFMMALIRKGREAHAAGGQEALDELLAAVTAVDPDRAEARTRIIRAAWDELP